MALKGGFASISISVRCLRVGERWRAAVTEGDGAPYLMVSGGVDTAGVSPPTRRTKLTRV